MAFVTFIRVLEYHILEEKFKKGVAQGMRQKTLGEILPGQHATVIAVNTDKNIRRRLLDIGLIENTNVECVGTSPGGDPSAYLIRGAVIALRKEDCKHIFINTIIS